MEEPKIESIAQRRERRLHKSTGMYNETQLWQNAVNFEKFEPGVRRRSSRNAPPKMKEDDERRRNEPRSGSRKKVNYTGFRIEGDLDEKEEKYVNFASIREIVPRRHTAKRYDRSDEDVDEENVVQSIIGVKEGSEDSEEKQYMVKWRGKSYKNCTYMTEDAIKELPNGEQALRRFVNKASQDDLTKSSSIPDLMTLSGLDVNKQWLQVDRILDEMEDENGGMSYYVKWQGQEYDQSTWESEKDLDAKVIESYKKRLDHSCPTRIPTRWERPPADEFKKLEESPVAKNGDTLRDYQLEGMNWLRFCWYNKVNNILADEMGLGKTAQLVTTVNSLVQLNGVCGPFLVIAPMSTLPHWKYEFEKWTDLQAIVYHGSTKSREIIQNTEFVVVDEHGRELKGRVQFDVLITNYETLMLEDYNVIQNIDWRYLIVDEAHRIKNYESKTYQLLESLTFEHCTLLTGTPIQNSTDELWTLLHFIDPVKFADQEEFLSHFGQITDVEQTKQLRTLLKPVMLRRKKCDVDKDIAAKEETIVEVELTRVQKKFYKALLHENARVLLKQITNGALPSLLNLMMQLRKVCNHPYLIKGAEDSILEEKKAENPNIEPNKLALNALTESSGKMVLIQKLLPKLKKDGHKVLIFSQMVKMLDLIEEYLVMCGYEFGRIDGSIDEIGRAEEIERFSNDPNLFVFLLSTKAGGVGINLTAADVVIIYDSDWNPQNDIQAQARCHRIGQKSTVKIYRLITRGTYESEMFDRASKKLALDHVVLDGDFSAMNDDLGGKEIEKMLRNGVYNMMNDDDTEVDSFCSQDIDQILEKRTRVFTNKFDGSESSFSKAQFKSETDNIDLDSKDFWAKVLPEIDTNDLSEDTPAVRGCRVHGSNDLQKASEMLHDGKHTSVVKNMSLRGLTGPDLAELLILQYVCFIRTAEANTIQYKTCMRILKDHGMAPDFSSSPSYEALLGEFATTAENQTPLILNRVSFFWRLARVLEFVQKEGFSWPVLSTKWESPVMEYAMLLSVLRYGIKDPTLPNEDKDLKMLLKAEPLSSKKTQARCLLLIEQLEEQIDDDFAPKLNAKFLPPNRWIMKFPNVFNRKSLSALEIRAIVKLMEVIGIPLNEKGEPNYELFTEKCSIDNASPEAVKKTVDSLKDYAEGEELDVLPALKNASEQLFTEDLRKNLFHAITTLEPFHLFAPKITPNMMRSTRSLKAHPKQPEWWTIKHDLGLVKAFDQYGLAPIKDWANEKGLPFAKQIKDGDESKEMRFLCYERIRVKRAMEVIELFEDKKKTSKSKKTEFPLKVTSMFTLISPGEEGMVGFKATREFRSVNDANENVEYELFIDENEEGKVFIIKEGDHEYKGSTEEEAFESLTNAMKDSKTPLKKKLSGKWWFGLTMPLVVDNLHE